MVSWTTARSAVRSGALLGLLFGALVANEALGYHSSFPTAQSRLDFARAFGGNGALTAVTGPARHLDTVGGFVSWRMLCLMLVVGAVWGLLTATRLLRGEEDTGRWDLLLSGRADLRSGTAQAIAGLGLGAVAMWVPLWLGTALAGRRGDVGFSAGASAYYALTGCAGAVVFLAVGVLCSQLASSRRGANALGGLVLTAALLVRVAADSDPGLGWLRWLTPLGWIENLAPLTEPRPWALTPILLLVAGCVGLALALAARRDVGAGALVRTRPRRSATVGLDGPLGLAFRLERWVMLGWVAGLAVAAAVFGAVARAASSGQVGGGPVGETVNRLGGAGPWAATWIGYELLYLAAAAAFAASGQVGALRDEEAEGHLDHLLARSVTRAGWLAGRLGLAVAFVTAAGVAAGLAAHVALAGAPSTGLAAMIGAGLNMVVPAVLVLGIGALLFGVVPRVAVALLNVLIAWSFLVQLFGSTFTTNRWLLDTAVLSHLRPLPAGTPDWSALAWMLGLAVLAAGGGLLAFARRDVTPA